MRLHFSRLFILILFCLPTMVMGGQYHQYHKVVVNISGLDKTNEAIVLAGLSIKTAESEKKLNAERIESLHQLAPTEIQSTLEALGYYHADINSNLVEKNGVYYASFQVNLGSPTFIHSIVLEIKGEGSEDPEILGVIKSCPLKQGTQLSHNPYEIFKQNLLSRALQQGYLDAAFIRSELRIDPELNTADIVIVLDTGKQFMIGDVRFQENPYPDSFLRRYLPWGDEPTPYTTENLLTLQKTLTETGLFRYIRVDPLLDDPNGDSVPLNVRLKPKPRNSYMGSIGYGTDSGPRGMLGWEHRRYHYPGHRVNLEVRASRWRNNISTRYTLPGIKPATDRLVFALVAGEEKWRDDKYSLREDASVTYIQRWRKLETMLSLHALMKERYRELPGFPKKNAHLLYPDLALVYTDITQLKPKEEGFKITLNMRSASQAILSSTSLTQGNLFAKGIIGVGSCTRLILRGELGATAIRNPRNIPLSLRYFAGGDQSVRGFGYRNLGPQARDKYGNLIVIGGRYLAVGSIELEQQIYKEYAVAAFYDTGQAMNKWNVEFAHGIGVGLRFQTPLGPLRFDVAQPLNIVEKKRLRIHLSLGADL